MKAIRQKVCIFAIATGFGLMASFFIFYKMATMHPLYTDLFLLVAIMATVFLLAFLIRSNSRLKTARLIIENQILHIQPAKIEAGTCGETDTTIHIGGIEVFISCFGMLLDSKVIKFNQDGICLKAVEIGCEFIRLTYGTDQHTQKIRILHEPIASQELQNIVERFRYETGVVVLITDR